MSDQAKAKGNDAVASGNFADAIAYYTQAIELDPENHVLYSNRSAAYASLHNYTKALSDALKTVQIQPNWPKGYSRLGAAYHGLNNYAEAISSYDRGLEIDRNCDMLKTGKYTTTVAQKLATVDQDESASKTNFRLKNRFEEAKDDVCLSRLLSEIECLRKKHSTPHMLDCVENNRYPPRANEVMAVLSEWFSIISHHLKVPIEYVAQAANEARLFRRGGIQTTNKNLYYPLLAQYDISKGDFAIAINLLKSAGNQEALINALELDRQKEEERINLNKRELLKGEPSSHSSNDRQKTSKGKSSSILHTSTPSPFADNTPTIVPPTKIQKNNPVLPRIHYFQYDFVEERTLGTIVNSEEIIIGSVAKVVCSLLKPSPIQVTKIEDLVTLSHEHVNLMHVSNLVKDESGNYLLSVSEKVCTLHEFCENEYANLAKEKEVTDEIWWANIKPMFDRIFGGVGQGLIHRFRSNLSCGDLSFSIFVSMKSFEGRILLSMKDKTTVDDDVRQWIDSMKTVIKFAHGKRNLGVKFKDKFDLELPDELIHLITFLTEQKREWIDGYFWVDHPYFWTIDERVKYAKNLFKAIKFHGIRYAIEKEFDQVTALVEESRRPLQIDLE